VALLPITGQADPLPPPLTDADFRSVDADLAAIGRNLFFDRILSGNRNISCATCHHPRFGTSDGLSLGIGEGGIGLGPDRRIDPDNPPEQRIGRNAPALFNLGAYAFTHLFHDGRLEEDLDLPSGIRTPLGEDMAQGFDGVLAAQTMFPVLAPDEMSGHYGENDVSTAVRQGLITGPGGAWDLLAARVAGIPAYRDAFARALPETADARPLAFTDIANALGAFIALEFRTDDSPFDRHLRGEEALAGAALDGMELFYGKAGCATCHSGPFQTDHSFHAVAMPQIGPGRAARFESHSRDDGRLRVTGDPADAFRFRTPSLRNVALTAPYGHAGSYRDLRDVVRHMADPPSGLVNWVSTMALLPELPAADDDFAILNDPAQRSALLDANEARAVALSDAEIEALVAFLEALTDPAIAPDRIEVPDTVPSGLPVD
jgi:cytochrome c peroxidase